MGVKLAAASGGSIELVPTNTASNFTVTVPAVTATMLTNATTTGFPAGTVLQVVNAAYGTQASNSTSTYADTGLTATITPTSATSKILVLVDQNGIYVDGAATSGMDIRLLRGVTNLALIAGRAAGDRAAGTTMSIGSVSSNYLDSPATTSATTYKTQFSSVSNTTQTYTQIYNSVSTMTLLEIAA
jgi:hypothetical protein